MARKLPPRADSAVLVESQVRQIRRLYGSGKHTYQSLADKFEISFGQVGKIVRKEVWKWVV